MASLVSLTSEEPFNSRSQLYRSCTEKLIPQCALLSRHHLVCRSVNLDMDMTTSVRNVGDVTVVDISGRSLGFTRRFASCGCRCPGYGQPLKKDIEGPLRKRSNRYQTCQLKDIS